MSKYDELIKEATRRFVFHPDRGFVQDEFGMKVTTALCELSAENQHLKEALIEAMIVPEAWLISGFPNMSDEAKAQVIASIARARSALGIEGDGK